MDKIVNPERLVSVPFSKTRCGVDFYINSGYSSDVCGVLTENQVFKTDFFSFSLFFPPDFKFGKSVSRGGIRASCSFNFSRIYIC